MQKTMSIIVPTELLDGLTEIAKREDRTVSSLVRVALRGLLNAPVRLSTSLEMFHECDAVDATVRR